VQAVGAPAVIIGGIAARVDNGVEAESEVHACGVRPGEGRLDDVLGAGERSRVIGCAGVSAAIQGTGGSGETCTAGGTADCIGLLCPDIVNVKADIVTGGI